MVNSPFTIREHVLPCQYIREYPGGTLYDQEDELRLQVKQYIPKDESISEPGAVSIIGAHANGFPKVPDPGMKIWTRLLYLTEKTGTLRANLGGIVYIVTTAWSGCPQYLDRRCCMARGKWNAQ